MARPSRGLGAKQGTLVTQETRSHSREENGNYVSALPSPPQALPALREAVEMLAG